MKKIFLGIIISLISVTVTNAQTEGKFRVSLDLGYAIPSAGGGGLAIYLEPKYNIKDNMSVGLRIGSAALIKELNTEATGEDVEAEIGANGTYFAVFDYNFNNGDSTFAPFVGAGLGYASIAAVEIKAEDFTNSGSSSLDASGKFGGMLRAGFEWGKFRLTADYNLIPESTLEDLNGDKVGSSKNSYFGITLGFFLGGGKWGQ